MPVSIAGMGTPRTPSVAPNAITRGKTIGNNQIAGAPRKGALEFSGVVPDNPWLMALARVKSVFGKQQRLSHRPLAEYPQATLPKRLRPYLLTFDEDGKPTGVQADRYEFWLYRQLRKRLKSGEIYLDDSFQHRCFTDELVCLDEKAEVLKKVGIPWLRQPIDTQLDALTAELHEQWPAFNRELRQGKLKHLDYDSKTKKLTWRRPRADNDAAQQDSFYEQLSFCDIADVFRFVNEQCQFLSALTPLQPRYAKQVADPDSLMAVIIAQAMNYGNHAMARTSDIPYHYWRQPTNSTCVKRRCRPPTTGSAMASPDCRSSRTTPWRALKSGGSGFLRQ